MFITNDSKYSDNSVKRDLMSYYTFESQIFIICSNFCLLRFIISTRHHTPIVTETDTFLKVIGLYVYDHTFSLKYLTLLL